MERKLKDRNLKISKPAVIYLENFYNGLHYVYFRLKTCIVATGTLYEGYNVAEFV